MEGGINLINRDNTFNLDLDTKDRTQPIIEFVVENWNSFVKNLAITKLDKPISQGGSNVQLNPINLMVNLLQRMK